MRTNVEIDDELMHEAMKAAGATTKRATVDKALRKLVALKAHEKAVAEAFRQREIARQAALREGRLDEWRAQLVKEGNWPEYPDNAD